jgi:hypothetical protein
LPFSVPLFVTQRLIVSSDLLDAAWAEVERATRPVKARSMAIANVSNRELEGRRSGAVIGESPCWV